MSGTQNPQQSFAALQLSWDRANQYKRQVDLATRILFNIKRALERLCIGQEASDELIQSAQSVADAEFECIKEEYKGRVTLDLSYFVLVYRGAGDNLTVGASTRLHLMGQGRAPYLLILSADEVSREL